MKNSDLLDAVVNTVGVASMVFGLVVIFLLLLREGERAVLGNYAHLYRALGGKRGILRRGHGLALARAQHEHQRKHQ